MEQIPLIVIVGPTGSGKTSLSVKLAEKFGGEIVSGDSMQIYRQMSIGTAKPTKEEMNGIRHHLIDEIDCSDSFSLADYLERAEDAIDEIFRKWKIPFVVGGTGLYISSLIDHIKLGSVGSDPEVRKALQEHYDAVGGEEMIREMMEYDPETAVKLHPNHATRIIRAAEVYKLSGIPMSEHQRRSRLEESPYNPCIIGLTAEDRQFLYDRIDLRVDQMIEDGLLDEVREILKHDDYQTAFQAIGYKEWIPYFEGKISFEEAVEELKRQTRRYAKRQLTWFRRDERIHWMMIDRMSGDELLDECQSIIRNFLNSM